MDINIAIDKLSSNKEVFKNLLNGITKDQIKWKSEKNKWDLLEIVCHLLDEEVEDFRQRVEYTLLKPGEQWPAIDPEGWVKSRNYQSRDYTGMVGKFIEEREKSLKWLTGLSNPNWENQYLHPKLGAMSARLMLFNWLAHDYFHIRQINRYNFEYLDQQTKESLKYAGAW